MADDQTLFASVIEEHLALKRKNAQLEPDMPLQGFIPADPFDNHALFKTEADAQSEEEETGEHPAIRLEWDEDPMADPTMEASWSEATSTGDFDWDS